MRRSHARFSCRPSVKPAGYNLNYTLVHLPPPPEPTPPTRWPLALCPGLLRFNAVSSVSAERGGSRARWNWTPRIHRVPSSSGLPARTHARPHARPHAAQIYISCGGTQARFFFFFFDRFKTGVTWIYCVHNKCVCTPFMSSFAITHKEPVCHCCVCSFCALSTPAVMNGAG